MIIHAIKPMHVPAKTPANADSFSLVCSSVSLTSTIFIKVCKNFPRPPSVNLSRDCKGAFFFLKIRECISFTIWLSASSHLTSPDLRTSRYLIILFKESKETVCVETRSLLFPQCVKSSIALHCFLYTWPI